MTFCVALILSEPSFGFLPLQIESRVPSPRFYRICRAHIVGAHTYASFYAEPSV
jgi:hypothetical protein